jgi:hypothetical protein
MPNGKKKHHWIICTGNGKFLENFLFDADPKIKFQGFY